MPNSTASRYTIISSIIDTEEDLATCRRWAMLITEKLDLDASVQTRVSTAVSEITRNALKYSGGGSVIFQLDTISDPQELVIFVEDEGPGVENLDKILREDFRSKTGLGLGISGSRRLVSRLEIDNKPGGGCLVRIYLSLPSSRTRFTLKDASSIRDEILSQGNLDPVAELKRQNHELLASLSLIEKQKRELDRYNSELKRSEAKQRNIAEKLHAILENLPDSIVLYGPDSTFEYSNGPAKTLSKVSDSMVPFGLEYLLEEAIRTGKGYVSSGREEVVQRKVNGEDRYFLPHVINLVGSDDNLSGALLLLRDVTNLQLLDDLKSDLLGTVSHEIKGPVTSVRMAIMLLLDKAIGELSPDQQELAETAKDEVERLLRMLNNLLDVGRYSEGNYNLVRSGVLVKTIISQTLSEMRRDASKGEVRLVSDFQELEDQVLFVDSERIVYALNNLVSNAIKHSSSGGLVRIVAKPKGEGWVRISVFDKGSGVSKEHQQLIFNRYAKAPGNSKAGVGLGLAIAREFVQAHGGTIGVVSEVGEGSEFFFDLPITRSHENSDVEEAEE